MRPIRTSTFINSTEPTALSMNERGASAKKMPKITPATRPAFSISGVSCDNSSTKGPKLLPWNIGQISSMRTRMRVAQVPTIAATKPVAPRFASVFALNPCNICPSCSRLRPRASLLYHAMRVLDTAPADHLDPLAELEILIVLEEMLHLFDGDHRKIGIGFYRVVAAREPRCRHGDDLLVVPRFVLHEQHADWPHAHHRAR